MVGKEDGVAKIRKRIILLLLIVIVAVICLYSTYRIRSFESVIGIKANNIDKIIIGDKVLNENYEGLISFFNSYEYKKLLSNNFDFAEEFPDGLKTYLIFIYSDNGELTFINPMENYILINTELYHIVDDEIDHSFLTEYYKSIDDSYIIKIK